VHLINDTALRFIRNLEYNFSCFVKFSLRRFPRMLMFECFVAESYISNILNSTSLKLVQIHVIYLV